ncbi:MAG: cobalt-precorrin-5B (C(1))-methyltransferase [Thermodesulfobacteriota bacterium]|nr:cobalt-precorrin-5B (C(1))-methyltransferase [Thermodesulfobacteriota bacterium]
MTKKREKRLRQGFTTGSAAAAGAKAGIYCLAGRPRVNEIDIPLPPGNRLKIPVADLSVNGKDCTVTVIKDAGDDPDVTNRARIRCIVRFLAEGGDWDIHVKGGKGVGRVTRPGLPVPVGESAINPAPLKQIKDAVMEGLQENGLKGPVSITIEVAKGQKMAEKTLNPRLGIMGGISILGTRGTVKPFSSSAYRDTITASMDVARAEGSSTICLSTGGKSERFLKAQRTDLPDTSFIQVADFFSFSLQEADKRGFQEILYSCFFGKLVKMAQGHPCTHAKKSEIDFKMLSDWCFIKGMKRDEAARIISANTAREALELISVSEHKDSMIKDIMEKALLAARGFAGARPEISFYLFGFEGRLLANRTDGGVYQ